MPLNVPGAGSLPALALPSRFGQNAEQLFPSDKGLPVLPGGMNMNTMWDGHLYPGFFGQSLQTQPASFVGEAQFHIETTDPNGLPRLYGYDGLVSVIFWQGNLRTVDKALPDIVRGMEVGDDGTGKRTLFCTFGASGQAIIAKRDLTTDTTPWTVQTTTTYARGYDIVRGGRDLYMVSNLGVVSSAVGLATSTEYHVSICPAGNDPTLAASWIGGWACGTPDWPVSRLAPLNGSICAAKADGLWWFDDIAKRFIPVIDLQKTPDANNGLGMRAVQNGVLYPTADGRLFFFDGSASVEVTPFLGEDLPRDIFRNRVVAICEWGGTVFCAMDSYQQQMLPSKVIANINNGGATDITTAVTSGDYSAAGGTLMATWGANAADYIDIWADRPFESAVLTNTASRQVVGQTFLTAYGNGAGWTSFTPVDGTQTAVVLPGVTTGGSLNLTVMPLSGGDGVLTGFISPLNALMLSTTVAYGGAVGNVTGYAWRLTPKTAALGFNVAARLTQVRVIPCRTGLPNDGQVFPSNNFNLTARDRAGQMTHIYAGRRSKTGEFLWSDVHALSTLPGVTAIGFTNASVTGAVVSNGGPSLVVWGRYATWAVYYTKDGDPFRAYKPHLAQTPITASLALTQTPVAVQPLLPTRFGRPLGRKKLTGAIVEGAYVDPSSQISLYGSWDTGQDIFLIGTRYGVPAVFDVPTSGFGTGRQLHTWIAWNPATPATQLPAPSITGVWVLYDYVGEDGQFVTDPTLRVPETT